MSDKLIITAAITGAELEKDKVPALPVTVAEQAVSAKECIDAGASVIHLHVRDGLFKPSQEISDFEKSTSAIRKSCGDSVIVQYSTGGAVGEAIERRLAPLSLRPEMASFNTGTINFGEDIFVNTFSDMRSLAKRMKEMGVVPEFEIYDLGHVDNLKKLIKEGVVEAPYHCQFVLGVPGALSGEVKNLVVLIESLPPQSSWGVAGVGRFQLPLAAVAIAMGGNVRVGLEDNIYYSKGVLAKNNAELVARVVRMSRELGRDVATPTEARQILGIQSK